MAVEFTLSVDEQDILSKIACLSIEQSLLGKIYEPAKVTEGVLTQKLGSFVTINKNGHLRGCIGSLVGNEPLYQNIARMAKAAAFDDYRFAAVSLEEWPMLSLEISVLGPMLPCPDVNSIEIGKHGLLLGLGQNSGVFLPKVPVEQGWDLSQYLENLCRKANLPQGAWQDPKAKLYWYEAFVFAVKR